MRALSFGLWILLLVCVLAAFSTAFAADEIHFTHIGQTAVTFDWHGPENTISYGPTTAYGQTVTAQTPSPLPWDSAGPFWEAKLTGLQPNSLYHYSIGGGLDHTFRTPPPLGSSGFTIYTFGDIGSALTYGGNVTAVQNLVAGNLPNFVLVDGDLTYGNQDGIQNVAGHFNDVMVWSQNTAYMPIWGNHEARTSGDNLINYKGRFDFPNPQTSPPDSGGINTCSFTSPSCVGKDWYYFQYGNVLFIAYPEPTSGAWSDWNTHATTLMDQAQTNPAITFIVTFGHRPAYSSGYHPGDPELQGYLDTLACNHNKYLLNINGHSHNYERTFPQKGSSCTTNAPGAVHITAGTGGSSLESLNSTIPQSAFLALHQGPVKLQFTASAIQGSFICGLDGGGSNMSCTLGSVVDSFTIGIPSRDTTPPAPPKNLSILP